MTNPNPFVPKGSLLEQQSQRRSRLKLAVFCVLAVSVTGLVAMLIQGCKRTPPDNIEQNPPPLDLTNATPVLDTNPPPINTNTLGLFPPPVDTNNLGVLPLTNNMVGIVEANPVQGTEYIVVKGDSLALIAKRHNVKLAALQAANPGVVPTKLKIGQKIVIPAGGSAVSALSTVATADSGVITYTVKQGDTLSRIAKANGTTATAIQKANNLTTTRIQVGQKLRIPVKAAPVPVPVPVPMDSNTLPPPIGVPSTAPGTPGSL